jgi:hypothetical protein
VAGTGSHDLKRPKSPKLRTFRSVIRKRTFREDDHLQNALRAIIVDLADYADLGGPHRREREGRLGLRSQSPWGSLGFVIGLLSPGVALAELAAARYP